MDFSCTLPTILCMARKGTRGRIPAYQLYGESPHPAAGPLLHVETIEARSARHDWQIDPHLHQALHQIILVARGQGEVLAESIRARYHPPALIIIPSGTVHSFGFEPGTGGHVVSVAAEMQRELERYEPGVAALFSRPLTVDLQRDAPETTGLLRTMRLLAREHGRPECAPGIALRGWLQVLLGHALRVTRDMPRQAGPEAGQRRALVARFGKLVEQRFGGNDTVAAYAAGLHVSESRLRNACLAITGQTPIQMIHARMLLEAKRRLHYTDHPIREIAYGLGFRDAAYFTRFFSRRTGLSPRAFRQRGPESAPDSRTTA